MRSSNVSFWNSSASALPRVWASTWYTQSNGLPVSRVGLPIQSPTWMWLSCSSGRHGILAVMMSLHLLFEVWWLIPSSDRPLQSLFSGLQRSLTREHSECAKAHPSLRPLTLSGVSLALSMDGLPKSGCLRISSVVVGSDLVRPSLTFSQALMVLFHIEHWSLLSLGAARSQLSSGLVGPLPWTGSLVWSALCLISFFQGSPPGVRPFTSNLASSTSDWNLGSVTPKPPWAVGSARVSHFTLALAGTSLPP